MDTSVVATALLNIGDYFDDFEHLQWVVLSYQLGFVGMSKSYSPYYQN